MRARPLLPGNAVRHCSGEKGWRPPELFNCTAASFVQLKATVGAGAGRAAGVAGRPAAGTLRPDSGAAQGTSALSPQGPSSASDSAKSEPPGSSPRVQPRGRACFCPSPLPSVPQLVYFSNCFLARQTLLCWATVVSQAHFGIWGAGGFLKFFPDKAIPTRKRCGFLSKEDPTQAHSR